MKWWEGKKTWPFIQSHAAYGKCNAAHGKCDAAEGKLDAAWQQTRRRWRQTRRRWRQIRRIWTDFDSFLRRNGTLMHIQRDLWPHTLTQHWPLCCVTSCILRPTHYIFMIMQIRQHPSLLFITPHEPLRIRSGCSGGWQPGVRWSLFGRCWIALASARLLSIISREPVGRAVKELPRRRWRQIRRI